MKNESVSKKWVPLLLADLFRTVSWILFFLSLLFFIIAFGTTQDFIIAFACAAIAFFAKIISLMFEFRRHESGV